MTCDAGDDWLAEAEAQVQSWLRKKQIDVGLAEPVDADMPKRHLSVRRISDKRSHDLRLQLVERNDGGVFTTELIAHDEPGGQDWISLSVRNDRGSFVNVPRLARYLMGVLPLRDHSIEFKEAPRVFRWNHVDELIDILTDERRVGLALVAGTDHDSTITFESFEEMVGKWTKEVYGLAQVYVLTPRATELLRERVGDRFAAPAWTIRTYRPGVRFDDPEDARRHRMIGTARLAQTPDHKIRILLGDIARTQAALRPESPEVQKVRRKFERLENQSLVDSIVRPASAEEPEAVVPTEIPTVGPTPEPEADPTPALADALRELSLVKSILGIKQVTADALRDLVSKMRKPQADKDAVEALKQRVNGLQEELEQLQDENQELQEELEHSQLETEVALLDIDDRDARLRYYLSKLKQMRDFSTEHESTPDEFYEKRPSSFDELIDWASKFDCLDISADYSDIARLDQVDTNGAALRTAWDAILTMADYAKARKQGDWDSGLAQFIERTPSGYRPFPKKRFAETETAITMKGFGSQRVFPVSTDIVPDGKVLMKTHFKLAKIGMVSPRMYIYDGHPSVPKLCIGYMGTHLDNTQTN